MNPRKLTRREEANALTALVFRNGFLEDLHAGVSSELLEDPTLSRIADAEIKQLMIETSAKLAELLTLRDEKADEYERKIVWAFEAYAQRWDSETDFETALKRRDKFGRRTRR